MNLGSIGWDAKYKSRRPALRERFEDSDIRKSARADVDTIDHYETCIRDMENISWLVHGAFAARKSRY